MTEALVVLTLIVVVAALFNLSQMPTRKLLRSSCGFCIGCCTIELVMMGLHLLPFELPEMLLSDKNAPTPLSAVCCLLGILVSAAFLLAEKRRWRGKNVAMLVFSVALFALNTVKIFAPPQSASALMLVPTAALVVGAVCQLRKGVAADAE